MLTRRKTRWGVVNTGIGIAMPPLENVASAPGSGMALPLRQTMSLN